MANDLTQESETSVVRYFHGGNRGLKVGEYVLPPSETGSESASDFGAQVVHRKDRVYVSTTLADAQLFVSGNPEPIVYEVEPDGDIEPDPDCKSGVSYTCRRAKIVSIHKIPGKQIKKARKVLIAASHRGAREKRS